MEENNDHKEEENIDKTPLRKARKKRISVIKDDMDTMRQELKELRFIYKNRDANYEDMMADPEYKLLFDEGSFTIDDYELHDARMYPSWEQILARYEKRKQDKSISLLESDFTKQWNEGKAAEEEEEEKQEKDAGPRRPVVNRDFYFDEAMRITADYLAALSEGISGLAQSDSSSASP